MFFSETANHTRDHTKKKKMSHATTISMNQTNAIPSSSSSPSSTGEVLKTILAAYASNAQDLQWKQGLIETRFGFAYKEDLDDQKSFCSTGRPGRRLSYREYLLSRHYPSLYASHQRDRDRDRWLDYIYVFDSPVGFFLVPMDLVPSWLVHNASYQLYRQRVQTDTHGLVQSYTPIDHDQQQEKEQQKQPKPSPTPPTPNSLPFLPSPSTHSNAEAPGSTKDNPMAVISQSKPAKPEPLPSFDVDKWFDDEEEDDNDDDEENEDHIRAILGMTPNNHILHAKAITRPPSPVGLVQRTKHQYDSEDDDEEDFIATTRQKHPLDPS
jgi:hypothetical protein